MNPPYQRGSVWTRGDREYFIDTIFNNYPSPAVFIHKTMDENGKSMHHVVDGKQRLETIFLFANDKVKIPATIGDDRLQSKRFSQLDNDQKQVFWNYSISVEFLPVVDDAVVNSVFERINRNARKLTDQELRHAKFDGWFIQYVEAQSIDEDWESLGVVTKARAKRMADVQFLSELLLVVIERRLKGFDQRQLDEAYGRYDDPDDGILEFTTDEIATKFAAAKLKLRQIVEADAGVKASLKTLANVYTLWSLIVLDGVADLLPAELARRYLGFMDLVAEFQRNPLRAAAEGLELEAQKYAVNLSGASTDEKPRRDRFDALAAGLKLVA